MIIGIGLGKTGTSSLAAALRQLGLHTLHSQAAHDAVPGWFKGDFTLHQSAEKPIDALVDSCFTRHFRLADELFEPEFILTTRNTDQWLESARRQMTRHMPNPHSAAYAMRLASSGLVAFHRQALLHIYHSHVEAVSSYFRDIPGRLLVLPLCELTDPWPPLCEFLGLPVPKLPFPHENKNEER